MGYNPKFNLDPKQLGLIEQALRSEMSRLAWPPNEDRPAADDNKGAIREINELLAHLHHQKFWFRPKTPVPLG